MCRAIFLFCCVFALSLTLGQCRFKGYYRYPLQALWDASIPSLELSPISRKVNEAAVQASDPAQSKDPSVTEQPEGPLERKFRLFQEATRRKAQKVKKKLLKQTPASFLRTYNSKGLKVFNKAMTAIWHFDYKPGVKGDEDFLAFRTARAFERTSAETARSFLKSKKSLSPDTVRRLRLISYDIDSSKVGSRAKMNLLEDKMDRIYEKSVIILSNGKKLVGEKQVIEFFKNTTDFNHLKYAWVLWHDITGEKMKKVYPDIVKLSNSNAQDVGFENYDEYIDMSEFEEKDMTNLLLDIFNQLQPLYKELYGFARARLFRRYPTQLDPFGQMPMHIFGDPWAKDWRNIFRVLRPKASRCYGLAAERMKAGNWTVRKMVKAGEEFFTSMGLWKMTDTFWKKSIFTKPKGRKIDCQPVVRDFFDSKDYRLAMCGKISVHDLNVIHYEMGHIEYAMASSTQPLEYRADDNDAFHNAVAATVELSSGTLQHLKKLKLLKDEDKCEDEDIDYLLKKALEKIPFIPFGLSVYLWRQGVYNGTIAPEAYNTDFWKLRRMYQGLVPPEHHNRDEGFDSGAKLHIASGDNLIAYLVAHVLEFQFYEAVCKTSGHQGPLHRCDFSGSKAAGNLFRDALKLGKSKKWTVPLKILTGQSKIRADSLLRYFQPLLKWLRTARLEEGYDNDWW